MNTSPTSSLTSTPAKARNSLGQLAHVAALIAGLVLGLVAGTLLTASGASADAADARRHAAGLPSPDTFRDAFPPRFSATPTLGTRTPSQEAANASSTSPESADVEQAELLATLERLAFINDVINQRTAERSALGERIEAANEQDRADLRRKADELTAEIGELRRTLESIATGGVDSSLFDVSIEEEPEGDWREDVALIAEPIIASLKEITEKPRRIKELNDVIAARDEELKVANEALAGLAPELEAVSDPALESVLRQLASRWQKRADDATAAIDIAHFQIANLRGDKTIWQTTWIAIKEFAGGRGLTLMMVAFAALSVLYATRFALSGYRRTLRDRTAPESRTRYRLAEYSMHALTGVLMLVAIFIVIYQRGDVLLLGLMILLFVGLALGARHLLPRYVSEARLLLNIGPMREGERLIFRDIPWRVESINMYTILRNPELNGELRIPLSTLNGMASRPIGDDPWFPSSQGDVVLIDNDPSQLAEVLDQNPDTVTLRERGGQTRVMRSADFYQSAMTNLTRHGSFGVECSFDIDYDQQAQAVDDVPQALSAAMRDALEHSELAASVMDVAVELEVAGDSAIEYWLFVTMDSRAAKSYRRIERLMQSACVSACTRNGWTIPFPHLSLVQKSGSAQFDPLSSEQTDQHAA